MKLFETITILIIGLSLLFPVISFATPSKELYNTDLFSDANLVSYYRLEDVADSKGTNTLTNVSSTPFSAAKFNLGADFGANNIYKYLTTTSTFSIGATSTSFTVSLWVKMYSLGQVSTMFSNGNNTIAKTYINIRVDSGNLIFERTAQANDASNGSVSVSESTYLSTANSVHLAGTYNGSDNLSFYVNGNLVGSKTLVAGNGTDNVSEGSAIGANFIAGAGKQSSIIDDVSIFSRVLTVAEIRSISGASKIRGMGITR